MEENQKTSFTVITSASAEQITESLRPHDDTAVVGVIGEMSVPVEMFDKVRFVFNDTRYTIESIAQEMVWQKERRIRMLGERNEVLIAVHNLIAEDPDAWDADDPFVKRLIELGMDNPFARDVYVDLECTFSVRVAVSGLPRSVDDEDIAEYVIDQLDPNIQPRIGSRYMGTENAITIDGVRYETSVYDVDDFDVKSSDVEEQ